nr:hypothetical protein [Luteibacter rhizovicinus]
MEQAMSKRSGIPPYRPRRAVQSPGTVASPAVGDAIATTLIGMQVQLTRIDGRLNRVDERFDRMDERFDRMDERFVRIDERFDRMDERFVRIDERFVRIEGRLDGIDLSLKEIRADVHVLTVWKERVFGVIITCGAVAAMLAFAINIIKMLELKSP